MSTSKSTGPVNTNPWVIARNRIYRAAMMASALNSVVAVALAFGVSADTARDYMVGTLIAMLPQLWFITRGFGKAAGYQAASLALGKFALSGMGFALWFALMPGAGAIATFAGTASTIGVMAVLTVRATRRPLNDK